MLCLQSCNLGCSTTGCARTDIAQNEIVILNFSEDVDPNSVNSSSIRFRTPSGDEPVGEFFINGPRVEFVPTLSISGGQTFFGFTTGETYTMTIIGGDKEPNVVRGTSGRAFGQTVTCTLQSTNGIVDLNEAAPRASLTVPTQAVAGAAPIDTGIQIEFDELIDATPFISGTQSPVTFFVRRTRPTIDGLGWECDPNALAFPLSGSQNLSFDAGRGVSILSFIPATALPGNVCIEITVTDGVADLSGRPAQPQVLFFQTEVLPLVEDEIVEEFEDATNLAADESAGKWEGGFATFSKIGGDARHGAFDLTLATDTGVSDGAGRRIWELDCDDTLIPQENTLTGAPIAVTDGKFFFSRMTVEADIHLRLVGTSSPQITVAGRLEVLGRISTNGETQVVMPSALDDFGQPGAPGGPGGGAGGAGGDKSPGLPGALGPLTLYAGKDGGPGDVLGGHAYATSAPETRGRGAALYPASGLNADIQFPPTTSVVKYAFSATAGGSGGGGAAGNGGVGQVVGITQVGVPVANESTYFGPTTAAGQAMVLLPFPPATGLQRSSEHFLVGGGGGGGAASNSTGVLSLTLRWAPGAGGAGGGGPLALRSGNYLRIGSQGRVTARGGAAANNVGGGVGPFVAPAGGGGGGTVLLQCDGFAENAGTIDVRGGNGGEFAMSTAAGFPPGALVEIDGGNGGDGYIRFETAEAPVLSSLGDTLPVATADNIATLEELDTVVSMRSGFYSTGLEFGPAYQRYEVHAVVDGVPTIFSDDPAISPVAATQGSPVRALFQCVDIDLITGEALGFGPWRPGVRTSSNVTGIASDGLNGYRFSLLLDRTFATNVTIDKLVVVYAN